MQNFIITIREHLKLKPHLISQSSI